MTYLTVLDSRRPKRRSSQGSSLATSLLAIGQLALAHNFFGNLYEAVVRVPHRISADDATIDGDQRLPSLLSPTSPVRYYLPSVPISIGATIGALVTHRRDPRGRRWLCAGAAAQVASAAMTGYLVRNVNIKLFVAGHPVTPGERDLLLRKWYRINVIRMVAAGSAWVAVEKVRLD